MRGKIERMYDGAGRPDDATKKPDGAYKTLEDACSQCKDLVVKFVDIVTAKEADAMRTKIEEVQDVCNNAALEVGGYVERIEFIAKEKSFKQPQVENESPSREGTHRQAPHTWMFPPLRWPSGCRR